MNEIRNQRIRRQISDILADNDVEGMRKYLESGGNVYSTISDQILLAMANSVEMAELLMDKEPAGKKGLQVAYKDAHGYTPFLTQANRSRPEVMRAIFQKYPYVIDQKNIHGKNALHLCVLHAFPKSLECAEFLLETKIDINAKTSGGYTALDIAIMSNNVATASIIKLLIQKGIDTTLHKHSATLPNAELVKRFVKEKMERERIKYNQAYRGLANKGLPENVVGINIKGFVEGPQPKGQGRPEYPARNSRKSRKGLKGKSRKGKTFKRKN